jgi:predicted Zn-dependent peptidase
MTAYYFSTTENFEKSLELLLEFVSTPYFTEESVAKEQGIIGQEIGMYEDSPDSRGFETLMGAMYENHPVRIPILGTRDSIARITPELLYACHKAFYRPGNMLLCVIGDVDPETVRQIALKNLPATDTAVVTRTDTWPEKMTAPEKLVTDTMEVAMPMFQLGFKSRCPETGEAAALREIVGELAAEALFGESSRLYLKLYEQGIIDTSFAGGYETVEGMALLLASGDSDYADRVKDEIFAETARLLAEGIPEQDFLRMKRSALGRRIRDLDGFSGTIFRVCAYYFTNYDYFDFPELYRKVTVQDLLDFLKETVTQEGCSMSIIYPKEEQNESC